MKIKNAKFLKLQTFTDTRGSVSIAASEKDIPFKIERTFHIYNVPEGSVRASHAHKENEQVYACLNGSVTVILDDGESKEEVVLDNPAQGLYVGSLLWHSIKDFSPDAVFFVWNSRDYEEDDYIKDYAEFLTAVRNENTI